MDTFLSASVRKRLFEEPSQFVEWDHILKVGIPATRPCRETYGGRCPVGKQGK